MRFPAWTRSGVSKRSASTSRRRRGQRACRPWKRIRFWPLYLAGQKPTPLALQEAKWLDFYYGYVVKEDEVPWREAYLIASELLRANPCASWFESAYGTTLLQLRFPPHPLDSRPGCGPRRSDCSP